MCKGCHQLWHKERLYRNLCPTCKALAELERGSRRERGIGPTHEQAARVYKAEQSPCALCGHPFGDPANPITVGHKIARSSPVWDHPLNADRWDNLQPECRMCNLKKGTR